MKVLNRLKTKYVLFILTTIILFVILAIVNVLFIRNKYSFSFSTVDTDDGNISYTMNRDDIVEIENITFDEHMLTYTVNLKVLNPGRVDIHFTDPEGEREDYDISLHVNKMGLVYQIGFLGSLGDLRIVRVEMLLVFISALIYILVDLRKTKKNSPYSYSVMYYIGTFIFASLISALWSLDLIQNTYSEKDKLDMLILNVVDLAAVFAILAFPLIVILALFLFSSNVVLLFKEGKSYYNMLGIMLGVFLVGMSIICFRFFSISVRVFNVHTSLGIYTVYYFEIVFHALLTYFECIMAGACIGTMHAQRVVPSFNKDYIIILGCGIRADGTLTPLLKGRADRAIWFGKKQKEQTGKDIMYVASGGQGEDEIISEGEAIKNYLMECGVEEDRILVEDKSTSTYENMKFSKQIIDEDVKMRGGSEDGVTRIAFSTTGYHVFRSGNIAEKVGVNASGIGSRTKWYFYTNALIREFIADLKAEYKKHIRNILIIVFGYLIWFVLFYYCRSL